jgi:hypothetical protein
VFGSQLTDFGDSQAAGVGLEEEAEASPSSPFDLNGVELDTLFSSEEMRQWHEDYVDFMDDDDGASFSTVADAAPLSTAGPSGGPGPALVVPHVRVGVGVIIQDDHGRVLVGVRKGSHGAGTLALPGRFLIQHPSFERERHMSLALFSASQVIH